MTSAMKIRPGHVNQWLSIHNFAKETKRVYHRAALAFLKEVSPGKKGWVERAVIWHDQQELSQGSKQLYVVAARGFMAWCLKQKLIKENPLVGLRIRIAELSASRPVLTKEQVQTVLSLIKKEKTEIARRDYAIIVLMLHTGLRVGGTAGIDLQDFERSGSRIIARYKAKGHGGKDSFVVVPPAALKAIKAYLSRQEPRRKVMEMRGPLFMVRYGDRRLSVSAMRKSVTDRLRKAGIEDAVVHSLRHTAATMALKAGMDVLKIKDMLGHQNLNTTQLYLHSLERVEEAAELSIDYGLK